MGTELLGLELSVVVGGDCERGKQLIDEYKEVFMEPQTLPAVRILMQEGHPLSYFSNKLIPKMKSTSKYVQELHSVTAAVAKSRQYLLGKTFVIRMDNKCLKELSQTLEKQRYLQKLIGYHFTIEYKPDVKTQLLIHYQESLRRMRGTWELVLVKLLSSQNIASTISPCLFRFASSQHVCFKKETGGLETVVDLVISR